MSENELINLLLENKTHSQMQRIMLKIQDRVDGYSNGKDDLEKEIIATWNKGAEALGWAKITTKGKTYLSRLKRLRVATKEVSDLQDWKNILNQAVDKSFVASNGKLWVPNFDWLFRNNNYIKLFEEFEAEKNANKKDFHKNVKSFMGV